MTTMFERLQADYERFRQVESALLDPLAANDPIKVAALAKERGSLAKVAGPFGRYLELGREIAESEAILAAEVDLDMRSYAEHELEQLRARRERVAEDLRDMIYDQAAGTDHQSLIVEVRAGTGGDEAGFSRATWSKCTAVLPKRSAGGSSCSKFRPPNSAAFAS